MLAQDRPQLRPYIERTQVHHDPRHVYLVDKLGLVAEPQRITLDEWQWLELFDGRRTLREIQCEATRQAGGELVPIGHFADLASRLDRSLLLEGPRFRQLINAPIRAPRCIGCYEGNPDTLRNQLRRFFTGGNGPGLPQPCQTPGRLRAALVPHIDYPRGGTTYAWGFKEVVEQTNAALFVIVGTSHYSHHRFTLTRKDFETPLGITPTDQEFVDRVVSHYGDGLFDDEPMAHLPEHSIELEVVFLQYLYEGKRPIRIVPLVAGSFQDCVETGRKPRDCEDVARMINALKQAETETKEDVFYIVSGDLAHVGPKFGDPLSVRESALSASKKQDYLLLRHIEEVNTDAYFRVIAEESDKRRICGLPPTYVVLETLRPMQGRLLHYDQYVQPEGFESVSFASMGFFK